MAIHHKNPILINKKQIASLAILLMKQRRVDELLELLLELQKSNRTSALTPIYPKVSSFIKRHWFSHVNSHAKKQNINLVLTYTSVNYINHIGCSCGKKINPLFLADEIVQHMPCLHFIKNILSYLPTPLRRQHIFYLQPSYREILRKQYKANFHLVEKIIK